MIRLPSYPTEPWAVREVGFNPELLAQSESIFALANGHLGLRGNYDEGEPRGIAGTYLNGFFESYPLAYGERGFGFPEAGQAVLNVTDGKIIRLLVEDEPFDIHRGRLHFHERVLDLRSGTLDRTVRWQSESGRVVRIRSRRLVSFALRSVAAIEYEVEAVEAPLRVAIQSNLVANQRPTAAMDDDPRAGSVLADALEAQLGVDHGLRVVLGHTTRRSRLSLAAGMEHVVDGPFEVTTLTQREPDLGRVTMSVLLEPGKPFRLVKLLAYHWSGQQSIEFLRDQVDASLENALAEGFDGLAARQRGILEAFWADADVRVDGDPEIQQALRFALFHLLQASMRAEGRAIPAKGLTGSGYDGHAFWDTETFVLPVLANLRPEVVREALRWRHSTLPMARTRAAELGLRGAAFPWRTIRGEECSGYWPAGTAALHVNADIAHAVRAYLDVSGDEAFAREEGLELLVETARLWMSHGHTDDAGRFRIDGVTGPDEYSALVDNNVYTNLMAQANLAAAADAAEARPDAAAALGVEPDEPTAWRHAAWAMFVPYDARMGLHPQDQDFLSHERWDFAGTPPDHYPLLLHTSYFALYRKQVVKQADLVLALYLREDAFTEDQRRRDFDYYEGITVRDSSLSACIQSIVAAGVGHMDLAYDYLAEAALMDLDNLEHNAGDGMHMASLAGAVLAATAGLGGARVRDGLLRFAPRLPRGMTGLGFSMRLGPARVHVAVEPGWAAYTLDGPEALEIEHWGERLTLHPGGGRSRRAVPEAPELERPAQPPGREPLRRERD